MSFTKTLCPYSQFKNVNWICHAVCILPDERHVVYKDTEAGRWLVPAWGQFWKRSARWGVVKHRLMPTGPLCLVPCIRGQGAPICQTCAMPNSFPWLTHTASHPHSSTHHTADRWQWTGFACQALCFTRLRVPSLPGSHSVNPCLLSPPTVGCTEDGERLWHGMVSRRHRVSTAQTQSLANKWKDLEYLKCWT